MVEFVSSVKGIVLNLEKENVKISYLVVIPPSKKEILSNALNLLWMFM
jgi:hypothetical protein